MTLANKVDQFIADAAITHDIVHGNKNTTVMTEGGPVRSVAKLIADKNDEINGAADGLFAQTVGVLALIKSVYYGPFAIAPIVRPDGTARQAGDRYFDTSAGAEKTWTGVAWYIPNIGAAALAGPGGTTQVGANQYHSQAEKNLESISLQDFGGLDDGADGTGSNNQLAFHRAFVELNKRGGGVLRLPKIGTGNYFVQGDDALTVDHRVDILADPGVSVTMMYGGGLHPLISPNLHANRELTRVHQNFGFTSYYGALMGKKLGETLPTVNNASGVLCIPKVLTGYDFKVYRLVDTKTPIAPTSMSENTLFYPGAALPTIAVIPARVGTEVHSLLGSSSGGKFFAGVLTLKGYAYFEHNSADGTVTYQEQGDGLLPILFGVPYSLMNQQRDGFNNCLLTVKVNSNRSFTVLANGLAIGTYITRSSIVAAGFGTTDINDAVALSQMFATVGNGKAGSKPLRIISCGDSITDNGVQYSHMKYLGNILGTAGIQIAEVTNIAVAGENAAQQYARLQQLGPGYDYCLIQVGVNDVQGGTDFTQFAATIANMVGYAKQIGAQPIVAIPTGFYSLGEATLHGQAGGQDTSNNAAMHTYRALLARAVASAGGLLNMETIKGLGPVTASWLNITPYSANDSLVVDNIHPTPYGSMMIAHGWARTIIGHINMPDMSQFDEYEAFPPAWITEGFGLTQVPTIRGRKLRGTLSLHPTLSSDAAVAMQLPAYFASGVYEMRQASCMSIGGLPIGVCTIYIGGDGKLYFFNLPNGTVAIALDGVEF